MKMMRINKTMRIGVIAAFVAILTIVGIAGTFAKYTTSTGTTNIGRVAKWGVAITAPPSGSNIFFATEYNNGAEPSPKTTVKQETNAQGQPIIYVDQNEGLTAPGTTKTTVVSPGTGFSFSGKPEVSGKIIPSATITIPYYDSTLYPDEKLKNNFVVTDTSSDASYFYFPFKIEVGAPNATGDDMGEVWFTVDGLTYSGTLEGSSQGAKAQALNQAVIDGFTTAAAQGKLTGTDFAPNQDLSGITPAATDSFAVRWTWYIDADAAQGTAETWPFSGIDKGYIDILDTYLGNQVQGGGTTPSGFASYFSIGAGYTITQTD